MTPTGGVRPSHAAPLYPANVDLLSHPFRLTGDGSVATVLDGTDDAHAEGIAVLCLTRKGERVLVPDYGITDPVFDEVNVAEVNVGLADFGPPVVVTGVTVTPITATTERVELAYEEA